MTIALGKALAQRIKKGCVIALIGDLGTGKTAFTKGIAQGLDIADTVSSPTFTLLKNYSGRLDLVHIDAYRLESVASDSLGLYDFLDDRNVVVIEWGEYLDDLDFQADITVTFTYIDDDVRTIIIREDAHHADTAY